MTVWTILFYAQEYFEHHLQPDSWEFSCEHDAEITREAQRLIAKKLGVADGLVEFESKVADVTAVYVLDRIGGERIERGEVHFISNEESDNANA